MSNIIESNNTDSIHIKTGWVIAILVGVAVVVVALYVFNFHKGLSVKNEVWGTFGDYVGGILNPVIAAFAFYLIAKSYELQKRELEATRSLLEVSTNAQKDQIKLAALTALFNSNLMEINILESEKNQFRSEYPKEPRPETFAIQQKRSGAILALRRQYDSIDRSIAKNDDQINNLREKNKRLEERINAFLDIH